MNQRNVWVCEWCSATWTNRWSASMCCDEAMNAMSDDDKPTILRGLD